jgi:hypothetical protein
MNSIFKIQLEDVTGTDSNGIFSRSDVGSRGMADISEDKFSDP